MGPVTPHTPGCFVGAARGRRGCRGVHVSREGGAAQGGPRGAVRLCVGGCRETKNARPARAVAALRSRLVPPATSVGDPLFCAPHSPAHFAGVQLVRQGLGAGCERGAERALRRWRWTTAAQRRVCVRSPGSGVSGERRAPWSQRRA